MATWLGGGGRVGPPITGISFVNLPNSRLPNQKNEKHHHRQKCLLNVTQEETSNSIKVNKSRYKHCGVSAYF